MLIEYAATEMGFLVIILMLIQITKALGEMVSLHFSFTLPNVLFPI